MDLSSGNSYVLRVAIAGSMLINALAGGDMYQTVCARAWETRDKWLISKWIVIVMDKLEYNHCLRASKYHRKIRRGL